MLLAQKVLFFSDNLFQKLTRHRDSPLCTVAALDLAGLLLHNKLEEEAPRNPVTQLTYLLHSISSIS